MKTGRAKILALLTLALLLVAGAWEAKSWLLVRGANAESRIQAQLVFPPRRPAKVSALGRLEPRDGVIHVAAPAELNVIDPVISRLFVDDGSPLVQGQVIAILDDHDTIAAEVERLTAELDHARLEKDRFDKLHRQSVINEFDWDDWVLKERVAAAQLHQAQAELALTAIRSPIGGRVLKVRRARPRARRSRWDRRNRQDRQHVRNRRDLRNRRSLPPSRGPRNDDKSGAARAA